MDKHVDKGELGKRLGMSEVDAAADEAWKFAADLAIKKAALRKRYVTTDDFKALMPNNVYTHNEKAWGPRVLAAIANGILCKSGQPWKPSTWPACHKRPLEVWYSLIYRGFFR